MKKIEKISNRIEEKIRSAESYMRDALACKEEDSALADAYFKIANDEMEHVNVLHTQVTNIISLYRKDVGDPPKEMLLLYDLLHKKHIENAAIVKGMFVLYKETTK